MKLNHPVIIGCLLLISTAITAQERIWSLEECINHALEHNLRIKQQSLNARYAENQYQQSRLNLYPNLNANADHTISRGRVRDEGSYTAFTDRTAHNSRMGISSSTSLFEGFAIRNTIERNRSDWQAAIKDVEKAENDLALNITALYLQILFDRELLETARRQLEVVDMQMDRTRKLVDAGSVPHGNYLEIRSLVAREALNVTQLENNLSLALLDLAQALDLENVEGFDVLTPEIPELTGISLVESSAIFGYAVENMPQIESSRYQLESNEMDVKIAHGRLLPRLTFDMGWGTSYFSIIGFDNKSFSNQFKNEAVHYYRLSLAIPVFNGLQARTGVKNAQLGVLNAQYELEYQKQVLRKDIQQAHADAEAAFRQYLAGQSAVESYEESFRYTERRFEVGLLNPVEYNVAKTEYMKAESDLIQAKYSYLLRLKILDFYQGRPISL